MMDTTTSNKQGRRKSAFLFSALSADDVISAVWNLCEKLGIEGYVVGGVTRNAALGVDIGADYDFVVSGKVCRLAARVSAALRGSFFLLDEKSSTYRVIVKDKQRISVDIAPLRAQSIEGDVLKRDFTVNSIAVELSSLFTANEPCIIDPGGGLRDASSRRLRMVSSQAFDEDPLRVLRAVRLALCYGLSVEEDTEKSLMAKAGLLKEVSIERVRDEILMIFAARGSSGGLNYSKELGILREVLPELCKWEELDGYALFEHSIKTLDEVEAILSGPEVEKREALSAHLAIETSGVANSVVLKLASFFHDAGKPSTFFREGDKLSFIGHDVEGSGYVRTMLRRLRFPRRVVKRVVLLVRNHHRPFTLAKLDERSFRAKMHFFNALGGDAGLEELLLSLADARATRSGEDTALAECVFEMVDFYFDVYSKKKAKPLMGGADVMRVFSVEEGPIVGEILRKMAEAVESGEARDKSEAVRAAKGWLERRKSRR